MVSKNRVQEAAHRLPVPEGLNWAMGHQPCPKKSTMHQTHALQPVFTRPQRLMDVHPPDKSDSRRADLPLNARSCSTSAEKKDSFDLTQTSDFLPNLHNANLFNGFFRLLVQFDSWPPFFFRDLRRIHRESLTIASLYPSLLNLGTTMLCTSLNCASSLVVTSSPAVSTERNVSTSARPRSYCFQ